MRDMTQASFMDCKTALEEAAGDFTKALEILKKKGAIRAEKKSGREVGAGLIEAYVHPGSQVGVLLDLRCETDFVARTDEFKNLAHELAMQIAAMQPLWIKPEDIPEDILENEKRLMRESAAESGKPAHVVEEIVKGRLEKYFSEVCLLRQPSIRNQDETVSQLIEAAIAKLGENIQVHRFCRFSI